MAKHCTTCGDPKPPSDFHKDRSKDDGLSRICKKCKRLSKHERQIVRSKYHLSITHKVCTNCNHEKPIEEFNVLKRAQDGRQSCCRDCQREQNRLRRLNKREELVQYSRQYYAADPTKHRAYRLKSRFGLTLGDYKALLKAQDSRCAICGSRDPKMSTTKNLHVDHCHTTGRVRGLLCNNCNRGLGYFGDNFASLEAAAAYLRSHQTKVA